MTDRAKRDPEELLPLTPAMFHVLISLADGEKHGYAIMKEVSARTSGEVELSTGTLYGLVKRMLGDGLIVSISAPRGETGGDERRHYYRLTPFGREVAAAEARRHERIVATARLVRLLPKQAR